METGLKLARKWGYKVKGISTDEAIIIVCEGNFHGRTITIVPLSNDPSAYEHYGPYTLGLSVSCAMTSVLSKTFLGIREIR